MKREVLADIVQEGVKFLTGLAQLYGKRSPQPYSPATEDRQPARVTTDETIDYQKRKLAQELSMLEGHLQEGCKINQKPCDCCEKHPLKIEGLALEAAGMSTDPVFTRIADWAQKITPITTERAAGSGRHAEEYPRLAIEARDLRKAIMPTPVKEVANGETVSGTEVE